MLELFRNQANNYSKAGKVNLAPLQNKPARRKIQGELRSGISQEEPRKLASDFNASLLFWGFDLRTLELDWSPALDVSQEPGAVPQAFCCRAHALEH